MPAPHLTEALIRRLASEASFRRGEEYYHKGAVLEVTRRGETLLAEVEGSAYEPYRVQIELDAGGVVSASCSCPYDWGGLCKHIVAVLLTYVRKPQKIRERPPVEELLAGLSREELQQLLTRLLAEQPQLADWLEVQLESQAAASRAAGRSRKARRRRYRRRRPLDPTAFRRQAQYILDDLSRLRPSEAYWATGGMLKELRRLVHQADPFLEAGDGQNALILLEAVTEVYVRRWTEFDDSDGLLGAFFAELGEVWAEALLSADLPPEERRAWARKLEAWQEEIADYGVDEGFQVAVTAAEQGWDDPAVKRVLQGEISASEAEGRLRPWGAEEPEPALAAVRLRILERQGRTQEYLNLARAEGLRAEYATMLVKLGRIEEAVEFGLQGLAAAEEALQVAQALREHGHPREALRVAEQGLTLDGEALGLARWLRDLAAGLGEGRTALRAARIAFEESLTLEDYQAVQSLAGEEWPTIQGELLKVLRSPQARHALGRIEIYLHEGRVEEAIQAVEEGAYVGYEALERVVEAALESHPDWAIRQCKKQAEEIMDRGQSQRYHQAVRWLKRARKAYERAGQKEEWRAYLEGLLEKHARKYALRPQLEALRG